MAIKMNEVIAKAKAFQKLQKAEQADSIKTRKINFDPEKITPHNTEIQYDLFEKRINESLNRKEKLDDKSFNKQVSRFAEVFSEKGAENFASKKLNKLAEKLVSSKKDSLAANIYNLLIKINRNNYNPTEVEKYAFKALAIAKRNNNSLQTLEKCNDLQKLYKSYPTSEKNIVEILQTKKKALSYICKKYETLNKRFNKNDILPKENYQVMLGETRLEIGKTLKHSNSKEALSELELADNIFVSLNKNELSKETQKLIAELRC